MSISAEIWDVTREDGKLKLWLTERRGRQPDPAGQSSLRVLGECSSAEMLVGQSIWAAGSGPIMLGETEIGKRVGYGSCVLFNHAIRQVVFF